MKYEGMRLVNNFFVPRKSYNLFVPRKIYNLYEKQKPVCTGLEHTTIFGVLNYGTNAQQSQE